MKTIWIATELFYPDETSTGYIMTKIAECLSQEFKVIVLTASPEDSFSTRSFLPHLEIRRFTTIAENKRNLSFRLIRFLSVSLIFTRHLAKNIKSGDSLFTVTNPLPLSIFIALLKKWKRFNWTILVHDVFPENAISAGLITSKNTFKYKILKKIFDTSYKQSDYLIALGRDMQKVMREKTQAKIPVVIIENWADTKNIKPIPNTPFGERHIRFQYSGNIGRVQGLGELVDLFLRLPENQFCLDIYGDGVLLNDLEDQVKNSGKSHINFYGKFHREQQDEILSSCDFAIVTLAKGMKGLGVPSKTYNILAAGKPILYIGDEGSEIDILVKEHKIGYSFSHENWEDLEKFLVNFPLSDMRYEIMSLNSRSLAENSYSEKFILSKFLTHFKNI